MANDTSSRRAGPGFAWPVAIVIIAGGIASTISGHTGAAIRSGATPTPLWIGPAVAIAFAALALALYVHRHRDGWRQWTPRKRLYWISVVASFGIGAVLGLAMQASRVSLLSNDPMAPTVAVGLTALWVVGIIVASIFYSRSVDDHERHAYYLASVAGFHIFVLAYPAWWVLARSGMVPPVDAMALFLVTILANLVTYMWFKFR